METVLRGQLTLSGHTTIPSEWPLNTQVILYQVIRYLSGQVNGIAPDSNLIVI